MIPNWPVWCSARRMRRRSSSGSVFIPTRSSSSMIWSWFDRCCRMAARSRTTGSSIRSGSGSRASRSIAMRFAQRRARCRSRSRARRTSRSRGSIRRCLRRRRRGTRRRWCAASSTSARCTSIRWSAAWRSARRGPGSRCLQISSFSMARAARTRRSAGSPASRPRRRMRPSCCTRCFIPARSGSAPRMRRR